VDGPVLLSLLPLAYLIRLCLQWHVDVPFSDQWEMVPRLVKMTAGTLSFGDVWGQHNEHRPMFPIVTMLALARFSSWNIGPEIVVNVLLGIGIFVVFAAALRTIYRALPERRWWLLPAVSILVFSPQQWENWLWGWQIQIFMGVFAGLAGFFFLAHPEQTRWRFGLALAFGVLGTYSFSSGLTYWVVGALALWLHPAHRARGSFARPLIWIAASGATIGSYFLDYHLNPFHPPMMGNFRSLGDFNTLLAYIAKYLGTPVAEFDSQAAAVAGVVGLMLFGWLLWHAREAYRSPVYIFPCIVGLNAIAAAVMTGLGRAGFGSDQAMASRYGTIAAPLWLAILCLGLYAAAGAKATFDRRRAGLLVAGALAVAIAATVSGQHAFIHGKARMAHLRSMRVALRGAWDWPKVAWLYGNNVPLTQERGEQLKAMQMSVFRGQ
jgi:hypothetical protein